MRRLVTIILALIMAMNLNVFAMDNLSASISEQVELSKESLKFLKEHNVDMNIFKDLSKESAVLYNNNERGISYTRSYDEIVKSVKAEAAVYNFTDEQIEQLINSSIHTSITFIVPEETDMLSRTIDPPSQNRPNDDGVGYEVETVAGYHTTTAFATLPTVYTGSDGDGSDVAGYMFWTVNGKVDIGLCYSKGWYGNRWRFCWLYEGGGLQTPTADDEQSYIWLQSADEVYLRVTVVDNNWILFEMYNADNLNQTKSYSVYTGGLGITRTNAKWRRQITLCTSERDANANVVFDGGASLVGAEFSDCYIYSGTETSGVTTRTQGNYVNTAYCGRFGIDTTSMEYVDVVDYDAWYYEKINIYFPQ